MRKTLTRILPLAAMMLVLLFVLSATAFAAGDPTDEPGTKMIECPDCATVGACMECYGLDPACEACGGTNVCATCGGEGYVTSPSRFINNYRLDAAWHMLRHSDTPIAKIAQAVGLPDASYFTHRFRARYGLSPSEIRLEGNRASGSALEQK